MVRRANRSSGEARRPVERRTVLLRQRGALQEGKKDGRGRGGEAAVMLGSDDALDHHELETGKGLSPDPRTSPLSASEQPVDCGSVTPRDALI